MNVYVVCKSPEELLEKLAGYYEFRAQSERGQAAIQAGKKRKSQYEVRALQYEAMAKELRGIVVFQKVGEAQGKLGFYL